MKKIFTLDTNIILDDPYSFLKLGPGNEVVIPAIVIEEVDSKKRYPDEVGRNARAFIRLVNELIEAHPSQISTGIKLENGGVLRVELNHRSFKHLENTFVEVTNDNRILAVALNLHLEEMEKPVGERKTVVFLTNDGSLRIKADALKIPVERYENDRLVDNLDNIHKGFHEILVDKHIIDAFYEHDEIDFEKVKSYIPDEEAVYVQDFFLLKDNGGSNQSGLARLIKNNGKKMFVTLVMDKDEKVWGISPKNVQQRMLFELLMDPNVKLVCGIGQAGTGKTLLALAASLEQTENEDKESNIYKKIIAARPIIPVGKDLGYLPGEKNEKLRPWMQPIYDNMEFLHNNLHKSQDSNIDKVVEDLKIEIEALTYIRGRSIPNQFIIVDECQNLSAHEMKTLITRLGEGSKIVLLGDPEQIDHPYLDSINNGLTYVIEKMKQEEEVGVIGLKKTERSTLADKAARLL